MKRINLVFAVISLCLLSSLITIRIFNEDFLGKRLRLPKEQRDHKRIVTKNISHDQQLPKKVYNITWYNPPIDFYYWPKAIYGGFQGCKYSNCLMKFDKKTANTSDAVIFNGRAIQPKDFFMKKLGQIWIFASIEAPTVLGLYGSHWTKANWVSSFNWTMIYDKSNSDIFLPYGEIRINNTVDKNKNYSEIFQTKNKTALIVHSNCHTFSGRETFVEQLGKYLDVDSFGKCGKPWTCGRIYKHDDCFRIINNYKFYLAFENAFCDQYFTEKIFRNFNYDSIMVIRGGRNNDTRRIFPPGTYVSVEDFKSAEELAKHLNAVANSEQMYTHILKKKNRYYSIPYELVYQRAMCDLCERMNKQDVFKQQIQNITQWAYGRKSCGR